MNLVGRCERGSKDVAVLFSFLVTFREGVEIALVVAIVLGYLGRTGNRDRFGAVWAGVVAAAAVSVAFGALLHYTAAGLSGAALEAFEGITMLAAVAVLTWMVFWMRRQATTIGRALRDEVDVAVAGGSLVALVGLAFSAVIREGFETVLFLFAGSTAANDDALGFVSGGVLGFILAGAVGAVIYQGAHRLPVRRFFAVSGVVVLILAAGLLSNGLAELMESGLIPRLGGRPWDTDAILSTTDGVGRFMHTLLGYDSAPTIGQIAAYFTYLGGGLAALLVPARSPAPAAPPEPSGDGARASA